MNATPATPLIRLPESALVWLDGKLSTTVVRKPRGLILEMRAPVTLPVYGPTAGTTTQAGVTPPVPPSATKRKPPGPNFRPRGLFNPLAKTETLADVGNAVSSSV